MIRSVVQGSLVDRAQLIGRETLSMKEVGRISQTPSVWVHICHFFLQTSSVWTRSTAGLDMPMWSTRWPGVGLVTQQCQPVSGCWGNSREITESSWDVPSGPRSCGHHENRWNDLGTGGSVAIYILTRRAVGQKAILFVVCELEGLWLCVNFIYVVMSTIP